MLATVNSSLIEHHHSILDMPKIHLDSEAQGMKTIKTNRKDYGTFGFYHLNLIVKLNFNIPRVSYFTKYRLTNHMDKKLSLN